MKPPITPPPDHIKQPLPDGKAWITELRKPGLPQTRGFLKDNYGECCLGVLCRVQGRLNIQNSVGYDVNECHRLSKSNPAFPTLSFKGRITYIDPTTKLKAVTSLAALNDSGYTFPEIADIIEAFFDCQ